MRLQTLDRDSQQRRNAAINPSLEKAVYGSSATLYRNYIQNPSFETNMTNVGTQGSGTVHTRITTDSYVGSTCIRCVTGSNNDSGVNLPLTPVLPAGIYTGSAWVKAPSGQSMALKLEEFTNVSGTNGTYVSGAQTLFTGTGSWQRVFVTRTNTSSSNALRLVVRTNSATVATFYVDAFQLVAGDDNRIPYFDGSTANGTYHSQLSTSWTGTAHASESIMTGPVMERFRNYFPDPYAKGDRSAFVGRWFGSGGTGTNTFVSDGTDTFMRKTWTASGTAGDVAWSLRKNATTRITASPGQIFNVRCDMRSSAPANSSGAIAFYNSSGTQIGSTVVNIGTVYPLQGTAWKTVNYQTPAAPAGTATAEIFPYTYRSSGTNWQVGDTLDITKVFISDGRAKDIAYFDGDSTNESINGPLGLDYSYAWGGMPHSSPSICYGPIPTLEVMRNRVVNPKAMGPITSEYGWTTSAGNGGIAATTAISGQTGPIASISTAARTTWSQATTGPDGGLWFRSPVNAISAGSQYTATMYVRPSKAQKMVLQMWWYDSGNNALSNTLGSAVDAPANVWTRLTVTGTAPANAVTVNSLARAYTGGTAWAVGDTLDGTGAMLTLDSIATDFFDGDTVAPGGYYDDCDFITVWSGTPNASISTVRGTSGNDVAPNGSNLMSGIQSLKNASRGKKSLRQIVRFPSADASAYYGFTSLNNQANTVVGKTYTVMGTVTVPTPMTGAMRSESRAIQVRSSGGAVVGVSDPAPNVAGTYNVRLKFTTVDQNTSIRFYHGGTTTSTDLYWDNIVLVEGDYTGSYFDGDSGMWRGTANQSDSVAYTPIIATDRLSDFHKSLETVETPLKPVDIFIAGDSVAEGATTSAYRTSWRYKMGQNLRAAYNPSGIAGGFGHFDWQNEIGWSDHPGTVVNPVWETQFGFGLGRQALIMSNSSQSAKVNVSGSTSLSLLFSGSTAAATGVVKYRHDGGSWTTYDTGSLPVVASGYLLNITTPSGASELEFQWASGNNIILETFMLHNGDETRGIRIWDGADPGGFAWQFASGQYWNGSLNAIDPDLAIIGVGANDYAYGGISAADTKTNIQSMIAKVRGSKANIPVVILSYWEPPKVVANSATWQQYKDMYQSLRSDPLVTVVDFEPEFGSLGNRTPGLLKPDNLHPTDAGAVVMEKKIREHILQRQL